MAIAVRTLEQVRRRRAVVLGYHGVAVSRRRDDLSMLLVAPDRFRAHVELLLAAGFRFVTLAELARQAAGTPVGTFAYPFGRYGPEAIAAARDSGMTAAVTTGSGSWAPYEITRAMIGAADPLPVVLLKLTDRYEPLLESPPMRALRRASKELRGRLQQRARGAP